MGIPNTTYVRYGGKLVEISVREHNIMAKRGHLEPVYKQAPIVKAERGLELRMTDEELAEALECDVATVITHRRD
jgi:hypothetical protein